MDAVLTIPLILMLATDPGAAVPPRASAPVTPRASAPVTPRASAAASTAVGKRPSTEAQRPPAAAAPRRLEDIHIEGEIPAPQVLFITTRDQRRFAEFQHHRYLRTSQEVGAGTAFPSRILAIGGPPAPADKEARP